MMKCPFCNQEMKAGFIQSSRSVFFSETERLLLWYGGPRKGDVSLLRDYMLRDRDSLPAFQCGECKKILIDYSE